MRFFMKTSFGKQGGELSQALARLAPLRQKARQTGFRVWSAGVPMNASRFLQLVRVEVFSVYLPGLAHILRRARP
jgi:hypothetical protein